MKGTQELKALELRPENYIPRVLIDSEKIFIAGNE